MANFDGSTRLITDLAIGQVADLSFIAPNQCNDQHGRGNAGAFCNFDPINDGTPGRPEPRPDLSGRPVERSSPPSTTPRRGAGADAIVLLWDENDYSLPPNNNQVLSSSTRTTAPTVTSRSSTRTSHC